MAKNFKKLIKIEKHPGFWVNPASERIYWRGRIGGRSFKKPTGTTKISEAKRFIELFTLHLTSDNIEKAVRESKGITNPRLTDLWAELVAERAAKKAKATLNVYERTWRLKLNPFWGEKFLSDVSKKSVIEFENWYLTEFPNKSFFQTQKYMQMLLNYLHREGYVKAKIQVSNLDQEVINSRIRRVRPGRVYTEIELDAIGSNMPTEKCSLALCLLRFTGARKMEVLSMKWDQVDLKKALVRLWSAKNKRWRTVPLTEVPLDFLVKYKADQHPKSDFLFPMISNINCHMSGQLFDKEWVSAKKTAKVKGKARVHDIRHTFASMTSKHGWPVPVACEVLDMSPKVYMKIYVHNDQKDIASWMKKSSEWSGV